MAPMLVGRWPSHMPFPRAWMAIWLRRLAWLAALAPLRLAPFETLFGLPPRGAGAFTNPAPAPHAVAMRRSHRVSSRLSRYSKLPHGEICGSTPPPRLGRHNRGALDNRNMCARYRHLRRPSRLWLLRRRELHYRRLFRAELATVGN